MILKNRGILGIDIGDEDIKIVRRNKKGEIDRWVKEPIPQGLIRDGYVSSEKALGEHLKGLLEENNLMVKECSFCLPWKDVTSKVSILPEMEAGMIMENLHYELEDYLGKNIEDYILDYKVIGKHFKGETEYWDIMGVAAEKAIIESYLMILSCAGLKLRYIDIPSNCLEKSLFYYAAEGNRWVIEEEAICMVDIDFRTLGIFILDRGEYFVERIMALNHIGHDSYQSYTREIFQAIMEVIMFYNNQNHGGRDIDRIILFGDIGMAPGVSTYLCDNVPTEIQLFSQWIDSSSIPPGHKESDLMFLGKAIGATIREGLS